MTYAIDPALPPGIPAYQGGTVVTVGTFDGVHCGHQDVLRALRARADRERRPAVLVTFDPHPLRIVQPEASPRLLTTPLEKKEILAQSGLDYVVFLPFTDLLKAYPPERFVREILMDRLRMRSLVIGYDHGFGRGRSGDVATLQAIGRELGFDVDVVRALEVDGEAVSSSRIRRHLTAGDLELATQALGRPYSLHGPVVRGEGRGRSLGFPTANIHVDDPDKLLPREGVYAVTATLRSGTERGALHLGPRPTFSGSPPSIELHLFDFDRDLYGEQIRVDFCARLRDIHHFAAVEALIGAIRADCDEARRRFDAGETVCGDGRPDQQGPG